MLRMIAAGALGCGKILLSSVSSVAHAPALEVIKRLGVVGHVWASWAMFGCHCKEMFGCRGPCAQKEARGGNREQQRVAEAHGVDRLPALCRRLVSVRVVTRWMENGDADAAILIHCSSCDVSELQLRCVKAGCCQLAACMCLGFTVLSWYASELADVTKQVSSGNCASAGHLMWSCSRRWLTCRPPAGHCS